MPRSSASRVLSVHLMGHHVGELSKSAGGEVRFQYAAGWLAQSPNLPISLSMPLREQPYRGESVQAVFDNLLPDELEIKRQIASRVGAPGTDFFSMLSMLGADCVGALQFLPHATPSTQLEPISSHQVSDSEIGQTLRDLAFSPLGLTGKSDFRISLAGAQEKTALLKFGQDWHLPSGATPTTHILKPDPNDIGRAFPVPDVVENEHFCLRVLHHLIGDVAQTTIEDFDGVRCLAVERFDRMWLTETQIGRLPQEDFCQALGVPSTLKYQSTGGPNAVDMLQLLKASDHAYPDQNKFMQALIIFWAMGCIDCHAKNFSLHLMPGGGFQMTPIYDVISIQPLISQKKWRWKEAKMSLSIGKAGNYRLDKIMPRHFLALAKQASVSEKMVRNIFDRFREEFAAATDTALREMPDNFPHAMADQIVDAASARLKLGFE